MPKKKAVISKKTLRIPVKYNIPDNIITRYATNMVVQVIENEFKISFFEQFQPIILDKNQPLPKEIQANCVASVIVTAKKMPKFLEVLQDQLDRYEKVITQKK